LTAADRPYGEFYDFYSVSPENFGSTLVYLRYYGSVWPEDDFFKVETSCQLTY
jgi:hypothetical protein